MTYAVIGGGNTGQAISSYLYYKGESVKLYTRDVERAEKISSQGLALSGVYSAKVILKADTNMKNVIKDAEFIIITTTASGHKSIINQLKPLLKEKQTIVFFPGYWGAVECIEILKNEIKNKNITVAETSAMPFISRADNEGSVKIPRIKNNVLVGTLSTSNGQPILPESFFATFPQLTQAQNIFETSLNNSNVVVHTPISLFNASRIDDSAKFEFYGDGVSPLTVEYIENLDEERRKIADLFHVETKDILSILNDFYDTNHSSLYEALPTLFPDAPGPSTLKHRYFSEDIPFGLVPISEIGKKVGVETPYSDAIINTSSLLSKEDYRGNGVNLEGITFDELFGYTGLNK